MFSKLKIEIYSKDLLNRKKQKQKFFMPLKQNEELIFDDLRFVITEITEQTIVLEFYKNQTLLTTFVVPPFKQKYFTLEEISKYKFSYALNAMDYVFEVRVEGVR